MSRHYDRSNYENHPKATELHDQPAHVHMDAEERRGAQDHLTPSEQSRRSHEHTENVKEGNANDGNGATFGHAEIAALAYTLWEERGCPEGSPEDDWSKAVAQLRARNLSEHRR